MACKSTVWINVWNDTVHFLEQLCVARYVMTAWVPEWEWEWEYVSEHNLDRIISERASTHVVKTGSKTRRRRRRLVQFVSYGKRFANRDFRYCGWWNGYINYIINYNLYRYKIIYLFIFVQWQFLHSLFTTLLSINFIQLFDAFTLFQHKTFVSWLHVNI